MKKLLLSFIIMSFVISANAQIGGLSPDYMNANSANCIDPHSVEFEPSFMISWYNSEYGTDGKVSSLDTLMFENELGFRFTYGISNRFETGIFVPANMSYINYGLKLNFISHDKFQMAALGGLNLDFTTTDIFQEAAVGLAVNYSYTDNIVSVLNVQYCNNFNNFSSMHVYIDNSYDFDIVSLILGLSYDKYFEPGNISDDFTIIPAVMLCYDNFYWSLYFPISVYGHNEDKYKNFGFALTLPID